MLVYSKAQKYLVIAAAACMVAWVVTSVVGGIYHGRVVEALAKADSMKMELDVARFDVVMSRQREEQMLLELDDLRSDLDATKIALDKAKRPVVKPIPNRDDEVKSQLLTKGFQFEFGSVTTLTVEASRSVLEAFNHIEAYDVAKKRLDASEAMLDASNRVIQKQDALLLQRDQTITLKDREIGIQSKRSEQLDKAIADMRKESATKEVKWWLKVGAGVAAGYLVGRATQK
jgi:uncharacterized protein (DUF3084 family)